MEDWFIWAGIAMCVFGLWALARHDWLRLTRPSRRVIGRVTGHRVNTEDGSPIYAAIFSFTDESGTHEVIDSVSTGRRRPEVGETRELAFPEGRPDLARPPRPLLWAGLYLVFLFLGLLLFAHWMGWVPPGSGDIPG